MRKNTFSMAHREMRCAGALSKLLCTAVVFCATSHLTYGQTPEVRDSAKVQRLQTVIISDSRVSNKIPLTTSTVDKDDLQESRGNVNIPYMLETLPSVVASGENGTVGATYIRIRGVDATRINVNINGITLNDPESQSVFWYNIPNFGGMAQSMQIQRGLGASTGGSPAFGAAINMQTLNAANTLADQWEGDSQVAFVAEQQKANDWYNKMMGIVDTYVTSLQNAAKAYQEADAQSASDIKSK